MPGYIKNVGDHIRMRWVQSGYDPDGTDVPPNKIIFDSDDVGALSVIASGSAVIGSGLKTNLHIVTWDYPFVPLCWISWLRADGYLSMVKDSSVFLNLRKTGIYCTSNFPSSTTMYYSVFNIKAADGES